jgi:hypothetical protein
MVSRRSGRRPTHRRFSVSLEVRDYEALVAVTKRHKPPLTLQYVVNFALQRFLKEAKDPQLLLQLGNPLARGGTDGGT